MIKELLEIGSRLTIEAEKNVLIRKMEKIA
jgi:hypothetical protein